MQQFFCNNDGHTCVHQTYEAGLHHAVVNLLHGLCVNENCCMQQFEANLKIQLDFCCMNTCVCILGFQLISYENNLLHQCCSKTAAPIMQQCTSGQMMQLCTPSRHGRKLRCAWIRVRFPVQGRICVADILPNFSGW